MGDDTWEYGNTRVIFSHPIYDPCVIHATPLDKSQFRGVSYEHPHTTCALVSCDYCHSFDYHVDSYPLLGRPCRLEALIAFNRELHLLNSLKSDPGYGYPILEVRSYEDLDVRSETPLPLEHDFYVDTHLDDLEE